MKKFAIMAALCLASLGTRAQIQWQTLSSGPNYLYELKNYPTARSVVAGAKAKTAMPRVLGKNARYKVLSLAEDSVYWPTVIKVEMEKKQRQGWILTSRVQDRTSLIPLVKGFRNAYYTNAQLRLLAPGMNADEVFVCGNYHVTKRAEKPSHWNADYTMWGDEHNFMLFYHDSLCTAQVATLNLFYYKPHYKVQLTGVECNMPVADQHMKESSYWDENMEINWALGTHTFNFALQNNSTGTLRMQWDDMLMVEQQSNRLIHNGTNLERRYDAQTPSVVAKGSQLNDGLLPITRLQASQSMGWICPPLVECKVFSPNDTKGKEQLIGKEYKVLFVLTRDDVRYEYTFKLKITDVEFTLEKGSIDKEYQLSASK